MDVLTNLKTATNNLTEALGDVVDTENALARAKSNLATRQNHLTSLGLEGKNEPERKANLALQCISEEGAVDAAEFELRDAKLAKEVAEYHYRYARELVATHRAELLARAPLDAVA